MISESTRFQLYSEVGPVRPRPGPKPSDMTFPQSTEAMNPEEGFLALL